MAQRKIVLYPNGFPFVSFHEGCEYQDGTKEGEFWLCDERCASLERFKTLGAAKVDMLPALTNAPAARAEDPEPPAEPSPYVQCRACQGTGGDSGAGQCLLCRGSGSVRRPRAPGADGGGIQTPREFIRFKMPEADEVTRAAGEEMRGALTDLYKGFAKQMAEAYKVEKSVLIDPID